MDEKTELLDAVSMKRHWQEKIHLLAANFNWRELADMGLTFLAVKDLHNRSKTLSLKEAKEEVDAYMERNQISQY